MADLIAQNTNPIVTFKSIAADLWRVRGVSSSLIQVQRWNGSSWELNFDWSTTHSTSFHDLKVLKSAPALVLDDVDGGSDMQIESDGTSLYFKRGGTTFARSSTGGTPDLYAAIAMAAGTTGSDHALRWSLHEGYLDAGGVHVEDSPYSGKLLGVIASITDDASAPFTYQETDYRYSADTSNQEFYVRGTIGTAPTKDTVSLYHGSAYNENSKYKIVMFHLP